jgi:hypothetical protein
LDKEEQGKDSTIEIISILGNNFIAALKIFGPVIGTFFGTLTLVSILYGFIVWKIFASVPKDSLDSNIVLTIILVFLALASLALYLSYVIVRKALYRALDLFQHEIDVKLSQGELSSTESEPASTESEPASAESEPASAESEPASAESEPIFAEGEPVSAESEPASAESEPASAESEPVFAEGNTSELVKTICAVHMEDLLHQCESSPLSVYFNVQVDANKWIEDEKLQLHLALQESTTRQYQFSNLLNGYDSIQNLPEYFFTPSARVWFVQGLKRDLHEVLSNTLSGQIKDKHSHQLWALIHIHNMMSSPLAILASDDLARLLVKFSRLERKFRDSDMVNNLGLPSEIHSELAKGEPFESAAELISASFSDMKSKSESVPNGPPRILPSVDFAMFKNGKGWRDIWGAIIWNNGKTEQLIYYPVDDDLGGKKKYFTTRTGVVLDATSLKDNYKNDLVSFGQFVFNEVFTSQIPDKLNKFVLTFDPMLKALVQNNLADSRINGKLLFVKPEYNVLDLIK